jgi:hypothetical protein
MQEKALWRNSMGDVALTYIQYNELVDILEQRHLSPEMKYKFKLLYSVSHYAALVSPVMAFPVAAGLTRFVLGPLWMRNGNNRPWYVLMSFLWPLLTLHFANVPIARRLHTEVLADTTLDGAYIRDTLKSRRPRLWGTISAELHRKGFDLPEMN